MNKLKIFSTLSLGIFTLGTTGIVASLTSCGEKLEIVSEQQVNNTEWIFTANKACFWILVYLDKESFESKDKLKIWQTSDYYHSLMNTLSISLDGKIWVIALEK